MLWAIFILSSNYLFVAILEGKETPFSSWPLTYHIYLENHSSLIIEAFNSKIPQSKYYLYNFRVYWSKLEISASVYSEFSWKEKFTGKKNFPFLRHCCIKICDDGVFIQILNQKLSLLSFSNKMIILQSSVNYLLHYCLYPRIILEFVGIKVCES